MKSQLPKRTNLGALERIASTLAGAGLAAFGLRSHGAARLLGPVGAVLTVRGLSGRCGVKKRFQALRQFRVTKTVTILRSQKELYRVWRDLPSLPTFMQHLTRVELESGAVSAWEMSEGPLRLKWKAEIVDDIPNQRIAWRSLSGGDLDTQGSVDFRSAPSSGTEVRLEMRYTFPLRYLVLPVRKLVQRLGEARNRR